jgi:hypothetical protein
MIDVISPQDLRRLADASGAYCVSIYLPTHRSGMETAQDPIRFKNLLVQARRELDSLGVRRPTIDALLSTATAMHDDRDFWASTESGLAVFANPDGIWTYRLPTTVVELAVVAERFHLKPLLPAVATDDVFYLLALSRNDVRVLRGSKLQLSEIALGAIPASLAEALRFDDREPQLQSHAGGRVGGGSVVAAFHGQGAGKDARGADLGRFLTAIDAGFRDIVGDTSAPMVLAGVEDVVSHFRKVSHYAHIVSGHIGGNPEMTSASALHDDAWALVQPLLDTEQRAAREAIASGSVQCVTSPARVVVAAHDGRIGALFVQQGVQRWGTFDTERRTTEMHDTRLPGDRDLLDIAAIDTLSHGGNVFVVPESEIPSTTPIAAILRH